MSDIDDWGSTAGANNAASPDGFPELMPRSGVNDSAREVMAAVRRWYEAPGFRDILKDFTYVRFGGTSFSIQDATPALDASQYISAGQSIRMDDGSNLWYGTITSVIYINPNTNIIVGWNADRSPDALGPSVTPTEVLLGPTGAGTSWGYNIGVTGPQLITAESVQSYALTTAEENLNVGQLESMDLEEVLASRRLNANGGFQVWQRGTSFDTNGVGVFPCDENDVIADNWFVASDGADRCSAARSANVPASTPFESFEYSLELTGQNITANEKFGVFACIDRDDGYDVAAPGTDATVSLSFWAKGTGGISAIRAYLCNITPASGIPTTKPVSGYASGSGDLDVTFNAEWEKVTSSRAVLTTSWQKFTIENVSLDLTSSGSGAFAVGFVIDDATFGATDTFSLAGVQVVRGPKAVPFQRVSYTDELHRCLRYCETTFDEGVTPDNAVDDESSLTAISVGALVAADWRFSVPKLKDPTLVFYNPVTASPGSSYWRDYGGSADLAVSSSETNTKGAHVYCTTATTARVHRIGAYAHANVWGDN